MVGQTAGRLIYHLTAWEKLSQDPFILECVRGHRIQFLQEPHQILPKITPVLDVVQEKTISEEVQKMLQKNAIEKAKYHHKEFVSSLFLVPKKTGDMRPVINLKPLNEFILKEKFRMETLNAALKIMRKGDYLASLDLKDAYFSIPIAESHRKYLRFIWKNQRYQFRCLPFGLTSAPRIFTKVLKPVVASLRRQGIRIVIYLDDILIIASSRNECIQHLNITIALLTSLGFIINEEKSCLVPSREILFLGFILDSRSMTVKIAANKCNDIIAKCNALLVSDRSSIRQVSSTIGLLKSVSRAVLQTNLFCRHLQAAQIRALAKDNDFNAMMTLSVLPREELSTWVRSINIWNGRPILPPPVDFVMQTDASLQGWGGGAFEPACKRPVVSGGVAAPYQHLGGQSSKSRAQSSVRESGSRPYKDSNGQSVSNVLCKSPRGNEVPIAVSRGKRSMAVGLSKAHVNISGVSAGKAKCASGLPLKKVQRQHRVVSGSSGVSEHVESSKLRVGSRHVRFEDELSNSEVCNLASRSRRVGNRCPINIMVGNDAVSVSAIRHDSAGAAKMQARSSKTRSSHSTGVEQSTVVSRSTANVVARSDSTSAARPSSLSTRRKSASTRAVPTTSRVDHIREHLRSAGVSGESAKLILASWRKGTESQYSSAWRKWDSWCCSRSINPVSSSIANICDFLTELYHDGMSYSTINTHRSAISMTHIPIDGNRTGSHFLVQRLLRGVFNSRPPIPRYVFTWPVGQVLRYFKCLPGNSGLSLKTLSMKTAVLLALVTARRGATLTALNLQFLSNSKTELRFIVSHLTKTSRPSSGVKEIVISAYIKTSIFVRLLLLERT